MSGRDAWRRCWEALSPNARRILVSHRPNELEREERLVRSIRAALTSVYGPMSLGPGAACQAEPLDRGQSGADDYFAATLDEIGAELGVSPARVNEIIKTALRKLFWRLQQEDHACEWRLTVARLSRRQGKP